MSCFTEEDDTILQNSDGSIIQCIIIKQVVEPFNQDAMIQITQRNSNEEDENIEFNEDEEQAIGQAIPSLVNSIIEMMLKQSMTILFIVILHCILNTLFTLLGIYFRQDTITKLFNLFGDQERAEQLFWFLTIIDIISCMIFYMLAVKAYHSKSYQMYQLLQQWVYFCFFVQVFLAYINKLNILLVFLKILTYIYSKFVGQLIKGIVNLPRQRID